MLICFLNRKISVVTRFQPDVLYKQIDFWIRWIFYYEVLKQKNITRIMISSGAGSFGSDVYDAYTVHDDDKILFIM